MKTLVASAWCALVLGQAMLFVEAQAPQTLSGRTIELTVTSGTGPFASSGKFRFLPSATDDQYAIVPVYGNIVASTGTYQYRKTGTTTAELQIWDSVVRGTITGTCSFSTGSSGSFTLSLGAFKQTGTFRLYAGASPSSIAGFQVTVDITSGEYPFAEYGKFKFLPLAHNTYRVEPVLGDVVPSHGTYTYQKNSDFTGLIHLGQKANEQARSGLVPCQNLGIGSGFRCRQQSLASTTARLWVLHSLLPAGEFAGTTPANRFLLSILFGSATISHLVQLVKVIPASNGRGVKPTLRLFRVQRRTCLRPRPVSVVISLRTQPMPCRSTAGMS